MSENIKFCLGLKLNIGLITPKEIQAWADKKILEGKNDPFVLDICFLGSEAEVKDYFNKLIRTDLDIQNEQLISINILKEYISKKNHQT
jgi:hydroxyethylthiazole kinase-like sugar kinase family protein